MTDNIEKDNSIKTNMQYSKDDILQILKKENPLENNEEKYSQIILVVELKKIDNTFGIIKGEYFQGDKLENKFSIMLPLTTSSESIWRTLNIKESTFYGFTLDSRTMKLPERVMDIINRSFDGATIQDFIPGCGKRSEQ